MELRDRRLRNARAWLDRAEDDPGTARDLMRFAPVRMRSILFHCQQSIEKSLKGFLTWHDEPFTKTHDLARLGEQASAIDPTLEPLVMEAAPLTGYAVEFRYPGETEEPAASEAASALDVASAILGKVIDLVPPPDKLG